MLKRTVYILLLITFIIADLALSQDTWQREYQAIVDSVFMENAYSGGDNGILMPRQTFVDIDNDNDLDLFIGAGDGDTNNGRINFYRNDGDSLSEDFTFVGLVTDGDGSIIDVGSNAAPTFCDLDADGDYDLFIGEGTAGGGGGNVNFYRNIGTQDSACWFLETATLADLDAHDYSVPTFVDIDADGDFDLFVGGGYGTIYHCCNIGDSVIAVWDSTIVSNYASIDVGFKNTPTFFDIDADGDLDLFIGNSWGDMYFYENIGTPDSAEWSYITKHYAGINYSSGYYPFTDYTAPAFTDIDGDCDVDLFISESIGGNINLYRNEGSQQDPVWFWETSNYVILDTTIDISRNSAPVFSDIDNDGDADMFIGKFNGFISFYKNNGGSLTPNWCLETEAYNEIKANNYSTPCFADIDDDNDFDLFVGNNDGTIYYYQNEGTPQNASWNLITETYNDIDVGYYSAPTFVDINDDNDLDLFIGNSAGTIYYYQNEGTPENASWNLISEMYYSIDVGSHSKPVFIELDDDGDMDLLVGNDSGRLYLYRNDGCDSLADFTFATDYYESIDMGEWSAPSFVDIDADGDLDLFIGEKDGGINFWRNLNIHPVPILSVPASYSYIPNIINSFDIANIGLGTMDWTAEVAEPYISWLIIESGSSGTNSGTITISCDINYDDTRTGTIIVTAPGAVNSPDTVEVIQANFNEVKLIADDGAEGDYFGSSVSISGDYAIIGASEDDDNGDASGSAYIFKHEGDNWTHQTKLTADDGAWLDEFGSSVYISGDYAIVGSPYDDHNGSRSGSAYIFKHEGENWIQKAKLTASDGSLYDKFGSSVYISDDYAIVGAYQDDDNGYNSGSAYIFEKPPEGWMNMTETAKLTASDGAESDYFGHSVCISGDYAIVGAYQDDDNGYNSGSAYIFENEGASWTQQTKLTADDGASYDYFSRSVSITGDYAIVGAYRDDDNGYNSGSSYIFENEGDSWTQQTKLTASDGSLGDEFGYSVCISDDYAIVGAYRDDNNGDYSGSAYIFENEGGSWTQQIKLTSFDGAWTDYFGSSVSISGDYAIVGAYQDDDNGDNSGSSYVYKFTELIASIEEENEFFQNPEIFALLQNYPNPFNSTTTIHYYLPKLNKVEIRIYNVKGQLVNILVSAPKSRGYHSVIWNGKDENKKPVSSGIYFYKMEADNHSEIKKCILLK